MVDQRLVEAGEALQEAQRVADLVRQHGQQVVAASGRRRDAAIELAGVQRRGVDIPAVAVGIEVQHDAALGRQAVGVQLRDEGLAELAGGEVGEGDAQVGHEAGGVGAVQRLAPELAGQPVEFQHRAHVGQAGHRAGAGARRAMELATAEAVQVELHDAADGDALVAVGHDLRGVAPGLQQATRRVVGALHQAVDVLHRREVVDLRVVHRPAAIGQIALDLRHALGCQVDRAARGGVRHPAVDQLDGRGLRELDGRDLGWGLRGSTHEGRAGRMAGDVFPDQRLVARPGNG
jgi:hypothetical protein